jgi:hypothetical protein
MRLTRRHGASKLRDAFVTMLAVLVLGCGGNENERDFLNTTKPGIPSDRPDEKVSDRRERLKAKSIPDKKYERAIEKKAGSKS